MGKWENLGRQKRGMSLFNLATSHHGCLCQEKAGGKGEIIRGNHLLVSRSKIVQRKSEEG